ncbi:MAG: hypothetical protein KGZ39_01120 [Simkania sp.]|nr:hypothetical protein [Simkania sp.]
MAANYTPQDVNKAFENMALWVNQGATLEQEFQDLSKELGGDQAALQALEGDLSQLNNQLAQDQGALKNLQAQLANLQKNGGSQADIDAVQAQITTVEGNIAQDNQNITTTNSDISNAQEVVSHDENALAQVSTAIKNNGTQAGAQVFSYEQQNGQSQQAQNGQNGQSSNPTAQQLEQNEQGAIDSYANQVAMLTADINAKLADIQTNENQLAKDNAAETYLEHEIVELSCEIAGCYAASFFTFGASLAGIPYLAYKLACAVSELVTVKANAKECQQNIANDTAAIKSDFEQLKAADIGQLKGMIDSIDQLLKSILPLLGNSSESGMQAAAAALVEVLQYLQAVLAQVHEDRSADQQWMSQSSTVNYEVSTNQATIDSNSYQSNLNYASFMKDVMIAAQVVLTVASVAVAVVTGGAGSILLAVTMAAFTAISLATNGKVDVMGSLTDDLAKAIDNGNDSGWSKVVADILIAVVVAVLCVAADGAGSSMMAKLAGNALEDGAEVGANVGASAAKTALNQVVEIEMQDMSEIAAQQIGDDVETVAGQQGSTVAKTLVGEAEDAMEEATSTATGQATKATEEATDTAEATAKSAVGQTIKKLALLTTMNFMTNNGLVDSTQAIALQFKSETELDNNETYQIIKMIIGVVQAILMAISARFALGNAEAGESSFLEQVMSKLGVEFNSGTVQSVSRFLTGVGSSLEAVGAGGTAWIDSAQATIMQNLGEQQFVQVIMQTVLKNIQSFEKTASQQFAVLIQQEAQSLNATIQKMGAAEMEAAKLLTEVAV